MRFFNNLKQFNDTGEALPALFRIMKNIKKNSNQ